MEEGRDLDRTPQSLKLSTCQQPNSLVKGQIPGISVRSVEGHDNENLTPNKNLNHSFQKIKV